MTAVQVTAWMSEAGNYHATQEAADADTIELWLHAVSAPPEDKIEAVARAIHEAMDGFDSDVSDMGGYEWDAMAPGKDKGVWLGDGQRRFRMLAKAAIMALP